MLRLASALAQPLRHGVCARPHTRSVVRLSTRSLERRPFSKRAGPRDERAGVWVPAERSRARLPAKIPADVRLVAGGGCVVDTEHGVGRVDPRAPAAASSLNSGAVPTTTAEAVQPPSPRQSEITEELRQEIREAFGPLGP